jgi:hypothetical protein
MLSIVLSPWVRAETIFLLTNGVHATLLVSLVLGLWPERAHKFFCIDDGSLATKIGIESDAYADLDDSLPSKLLCSPKMVCAISSSDGDNPFV